MSAADKTDLIITPATWTDQKENLGRTATNLLNLVGWYGSTHDAAMWRKANEFLAVFQAQHVAGFDPQIEEWQPSFALTEAEVLATASVIIIRLENNELLNGSLGSIAEIGLALTSAALRGQIVIVSIEDGLLTSLNEPGAIAQYMMLEMFLENIAEVAALAPYLRIHRGDHLQELAQLACQTAQQQLTTAQQSLDFNDFLVKKAQHKQHYPLRVLLGGSGGPYTPTHADTFMKKKKSLISSYPAQGHVVKVLSEGAIAEAWSIPYGSVDNIGIALAMRALLSIEIEYKQEADLLLLPIMAEAESKAASTEIGFLLLHALTTGQDIRVFLEPFDPVDYIRHQFKDVNIAGCTTEKLMRIALRQAGVAAGILATAGQEEILATFEIFKQLMTDHRPTFKQVKQSLLGQTETFHNADNTRRVRLLVEAHLERLSADERFPDFFSYSTSILPSR